MIAATASNVFILHGERNLQRHLVGDLLRTSPPPRSSTMSLPKAGSFAIFVESFGGRLARDRALLLELQLYVALQSLPGGK